MECPIALGGEFVLELSENVLSFDWKEASKLNFSSGGSGGVLFVSFNNGKKLVLKGTMEPAREVFSSRLMRRLGLGHPVVRPIGFADAEWRSLEEAMLRLESSLLADERIRLKRLLSRPVVLVMEFVSGRPLPDLTNPKALAAERYALNRLGGVAAFDAWINNFDRLPLGELWNNDGNFGNLMLTSLSADNADKTVVAVDSAIYPIRETFPNGQPNLQHAKYLKKLSDIVVQVRNEKEESNAVARLREGLLFGAGQQVEDGMHIQSGLAEMFQKISDTLTDDVLAAEKEVVGKMIEIDWEDVWKKDVAAIDLAFLAQTRNALK